MGGAISAFTLDRTSLPLFTLPAVGMFVLRLLAEGTSISVATGGLLLVFALFTFASARRFSVVEMGSLRLNRETREHERMLRRYEFIVNAVPDAMSVINREHRYEAVNDAWCALLKRRREEVIGRPPAEIWGRDRYINHIAPQLERVELSLEPVSVSSVVAESLAMVAPLAQKQGVTCEGGVGPCERLAVRGDHSRLRQILINLLSNAIKYNRPQGRVTLACAPRGGSLRIGVSDTGVGIPADKQDRISSSQHEQELAA